MKKNWIIPPAWFTAARWFLGLLLLWASISKLSNPTEFLASLYAYQLPLSRFALQVLAVILPWAELLCGLLLLFNAWTETALVAVTILFVVFVFSTGQAWARGLDISCGCFNLKLLGIKSDTLSKFLESVSFAFFRNLVLTLLAWALLRKRILELANTGEPSPVIAPAPSVRRQRGRK